MLSQNYNRSTNVAMEHNGYGLAKGKIESTNVQPLHNANRKHQSPMLALMFAFCQTDVVRCFVYKSQCG